jgi:hypothetical protein
MISKLHKFYTHTFIFQNKLQYRIINFCPNDISICICFNQTNVGMKNLLHCCFLIQFYNKHYSIRGHQSLYLFQDRVVMDRNYKIAALSMNKKKQKPGVIVFS